MKPREALQGIFMNGRNHKIEKIIGEDESITMAINWLKRRVDHIPSSNRLKQERIVVSFIQIEPKHKESA